MMYEHSDTLITPEDAADILHCGMNAMYKLLRAGKIKAFRVGRIWKIPRRAVQEFIVEASQMKAPIWY